MANGWSYSMNYDEENKKSPNLKPFKLLHDHDHEEYKVEIRQKLRIIFSLGFHIEKPASESTLPKQQSGPPERSSKLAAANAAPQPSVAVSGPNSILSTILSLFAGARRRNEYRVNYHGRFCRLNKLVHSIKMSSVSYNEASNIKIKWINRGFNFLDNLIWETSCFCFSTSEKIISFSIISERAF